MNELLDTILLSNGRSSYLIDLIKHDSGIKYIRIEYIKQKQRCSININPIILTDLIEVLNNYKKKIDNNLTIIDSNKKIIPKELQDKAALISNRYLKGVQVKDLAMQFDCDANLIEMILENKDIEIVPNKLSTTWKRKKKTKSKM